MYASDTLWLFSYHQTEYTDFPRKVFAMIRFVEEKKYSLIKFRQMNFVNDYAEKLPNYEVYSNPKYYVSERRDDSFMQNVI